MFLLAFAALAAPRVHGDARGAPLPGEDLSERAVTGLAEVGRRLGIDTSRHTLARIHPLRGGGIAIWRATADGLPVADGDVKVVIDARGRLVGWSAGAAAGLDLTGGSALLDADEAARLVGGGRVRGVAVAIDGRLRRAWEIEHPASDGLWQVTIDAGTGAELGRVPLTASHSYGVWADADLKPLDSPFEDLTPHPTGLLDHLEPLLVPPALVDVPTGLNGPGDPWLDPAATTTEGNHALAYADRLRPSGLGANDFVGEVSAPGAFDWPYDFDESALATEEQAQPGLAQAFYTVNWLHDRFYDSGFDEAAGNAQADNYGRGGVGGDPMLVEVQDDALNQRGNANMSTPADGVSPTMQIYLFDRQELLVDGAWFAAVGSAEFGPQEFVLERPLAEAGSDPTACAVVDGDVVDRIVLADRGACDFVVKVALAQVAGAAGVLVVNDEDALYGMAGEDEEVVVPSLLVSASDGAALRARLAAGPVTATLLRTAIDGALDTTLVAHEWGHYLFHRNVAGCGSTECSALSEGNSDVVALLMALRDGDDRDGAYPLAAYAFQSGNAASTYFGVRRAPYSRDPAVNALSFRHVVRGEPLPTSHPLLAGGSNAEVHNAGEVWASAAFDAYLALQDEAAATGRTFADGERRMTDVLAAGLALAPSNPSFLDLRDALLVAANALEPADAVAMAEAFAGRGMGACAIGPDPGSRTLEGVVEDTSLGASRARLTDLAVTADDGCDGDGYLDAGERGTVSVVVTNESVTPLAGAVLTVSVDALPVSFPDGAAVAVPDLAAFASATVEVPIAADATATSAGGPLVATLAGAICGDATSAQIGLRIETDAVSGAAAGDDFAVDDGSWTTDGDGADEVWGRVADPETGLTSWVGEDGVGVGDTRLVSPVMDVAGDLVITLVHRYDFEADEDDGVYWDGGVLELRVDGGPWEDVSGWVDPGYDAVLTDEAGNPLASRPAFTGQNGSWPAPELLVLDLGDAFVGRGVELSLRIGTDPAGAAFGWELVVIEAVGLSNLPFPAEVDDVSSPADWHADADGDGFGDPAASVPACVAPADHVADAGDCDDADAAVNPAAVEVCNGVDDDCDGVGDPCDPPGDDDDDGTPGPRSGRGEDGGGCGCASGAGGAWWLVGVAGVVLRRGRR